MSRELIEKKVAELVRTLLTDGPIELVDVEFVQERDWYLRVYIDKSGGVTLDDCAELSRKLDLLLDQEDFIQRAYLMEVSSPGLDRPLKNDSDFTRYAGQTVDVSFFAPKNGKKQITCELVGLEADRVQVLLDGKVESWLRSEISTVRLHVLIPSGKKKSNK